MPGTPVGNGLTDLLTDLQESANATLRALINNLSISSGPQVVVNDDRLSPDETGEDLYPWKRWHVRNDPVSNNNQQPISFFQPQAVAQQLIAVFQEFVSIADDVSAIPKYIGGQAGAGGAGRTASGLAMLMGNTSKILQTVSANIDRDIWEPVLMNLVDMIMLTDTTGLLTGEEKIGVRGVSVAVQRETLRQRQIEFLQATNNPVDMHIVGIKGRGAVLRSVSRDIGMDGEEVVPSEQQLEAMDEAQKQQQSQAQQQGPIQEQIQKGVNQGVEAGIQRITTEITAGVLASRFQMPEGPPAHIGTPEGGMAGPATNNPGMDLGNMAAQAQGNQPSQLTAGGLGPTTANLAGNAPGPSAAPISPGPG